MTFRLTWNKVIFRWKKQKLNSQVVKNLVKHDKKNARRNFDTSPAFSSGIEPMRC